MTVLNKRYIFTNQSLTLFNCIKICVSYDVNCWLQLVNNIANSKTVNLTFVQNKNSLDRMILIYAYVYICILLYNQIILIIEEMYIYFFLLLSCDYVKIQCFLIHINIKIMHTCIDNVRKYHVLKQRLNIGNKIFPIK